MDTWVAVAVGIIPSIGVGLLFWFSIRAVIRADRNERAALAREDAALSAKDRAEAPDEPPAA
ncbi:MAG: hypothetical protein ACLGHM_04965 [Actinomycetes bacterium]